MITGLDIAVIILYFIVVLGIGFFYRKQRTTEEYIVAGRKVGFWASLGTWFATGVGGGFSMGIIGKAYGMGYAGVWILITYSFGFMMLYVLLPRVRALGDRYKFLTLPEMMGFRMGNLVRVLAGIVTIMGIVGFVADNFVALGRIIQAYVGWDITSGILLAALITTIYTFLGGMMAVIVTDLIQWVIAMIGIVLITFPITLIAAGGWGAITATLPPQYFDPFTIPGLAIAGMFVSMIFGVNFQQHFIQRQWSPVDKKTTLYSAIAANVNFFVFAAICALIGMAGAVIFPGLEAGSLVLPHLIKELLPTGISGLVIAAFIALIMSSVDSFLLTISSSLSKDIIGTAKPDLSDEKMVLATRLSVVVLAILAIIIAIIYPNILGLIIAFFQMIASGLGIPVLATLFWKRATPAGVAAGIIVGSAVAVSVKLGLLSVFGLGPALVGVPASFIATVLISLLTKPQPEEMIKKYFIRW
jgi:SSS family solute:Na+ symporter